MPHPKIAVAQIPSIAGDITANIATHLIAIERAAQNLGSGVYPLFFQKSDAHQALLSLRRTCDRIRIASHGALKTAPYGIYLIQ